MKNSSRFSTGGGKRGLGQDHLRAFQKSVGMGSCTERLDEAGPTWSGNGGGKAQRSFDLGHLRLPCLVDVYDLLGGGPAPVLSTSGPDAWSCAQGAS